MPDAFARLHEERATQLDAFLHDSQMLAVTEHFVTSLAEQFAARRVVPRDPYVPLLALLRMAEIDATAAMGGAIADTTTALGAPSQLQASSADGQVVTIIPAGAAAAAPRPLSIWGARAVLERAASSDTWLVAIQTLQNALSDWIATQDATDDGYRMRSIGVLVGAAIWTAGGRDRTCGAALPFHIEMERHIVVAGARLEDGISTFARALLRMLHDATSGRRACMWRNAAPYLEIDGSDEHWTCARAQDQRVAFFAAIKTALVGRVRLLLRWMQTIDDPDQGLDHDHQQQQGTPHLAMCAMSVFFHFDAATVKSSNPTFASASRALELGIFASAEAASEIVRRLQLQATLKTEKASAASPLPPTRSAPTVEPQTLTALLDSIQQTCRSPNECRYWLAAASHSLADRLLGLVDALRVALDGLALAQASDLPQDLLHAHLQFCAAWFDRLLADAAIEPLSSLFLGVETAIATTWRAARSIASAFNQSLDSALAPLLQRVQMQLEILAAATTQVFMRTVQRSVGCGVDSTCAARQGNELIDLHAEITEATTQRRYPDALSTECVFAQFVADAWLDVALESALRNAVADRLPHYPFVELSRQARVFALRQRSWNVPLDESARVLPVLQAIDVASPLGIFESTGGLVSANARLLQLVDPQRVLQVRQWLTSSKIVASDAYGALPLKASYSARGFVSLLLSDPKRLLHILPRAELDDTTSPVAPMHVDVAEHIIIEGASAALATTFFAVAVRREVERVRKQVQHMAFSMQLIGPQGECITHVQVQDAQDLERLVLEAASQQCMLQTRALVVAGGGRLGCVTKSFVLHHIQTEGVPTADAAMLSSSMCHRLRHLGIFFEEASARIALNAVAATERDLHFPQAGSTPEAPDDELLQFVMGLTQTPDQEQTKPISTMVTHRPEILQRLLFHSPLPVMLDAEAALWSVIEALEGQIGQSDVALPKTIGSAIDATLAQVDHDVRPALLPCALGPVDATALERQRQTLQQAAMRNPTSVSDVLEATRRLLVAAELARFAHQHAFFAAAMPLAPRPDVAPPQ